MFSKTKYASYGLVGEFTKMKMTTNPKDGESYLVMNQHQKCIFAKRLNEFGRVQLVQSNCNPDEKGQIWKWSNNTLFNDFGIITRSKSSTRKTPTGLPIFDIYLMNRVIYDTLRDQKWNASGGNQLISSDGSCLSVDKKSDAPGAFLSAGICIDREKDSFWYFLSTI